MKQRIISLAISALLTFGGGIATLAAVPDCGEAVDVIVGLKDCGSESIQYYAEKISGRFPDADYGYLYDTLLCGFQLTLPENLIYMLASCGEVENVWLCGEYEPCSYSQTSVGNSMPATDMIGFGAAEAAGLTGDGVIIAVIDNGFDIAHPALQSRTITATLSSRSLGDLLGTRKLSVSRYVSAAAEVYINSKLPFVFDYAGHDSDVSSASSHGTHVAGIIGALETETDTMRGIAAGSQLLLMKVFDDSGVSASDAAIIAALEDSVKLGADVINLSLGRYSGSAETQMMVGMDSLIKKAEEAGCIIVCAAGNESVSTKNGGIAGESGITLPTADYTDYGTVSYPASAEYSFAAGSVDNSVTYAPFFRLANRTDREFYYTDTNLQRSSLGVSFAEYFNKKSLQYSVIPGIGTEEDYAGIDVKGKLALVSRGTTTFVEKANIAASHGAVGMIIYNNTDDNTISLELTGTEIPAIAISLNDGKILAESKTHRLLFDKSFTNTINNETAGLISSFSSWGCTPSLTLKPEICAVGGSVYSTLNSGGYGGMTGTSMAAPQLSGVCALLLENFNKTGEMTDKSKRSKEMKKLLMNTANQVRQPDGIEYSPRFQGAGLVDLNAALSSELEIVYSFNGLPKAELYDLIGDIIYLDITLTNRTDSPLEFSLGATLTGDGYEKINYSRKDLYFSTLEAVPDRLSVITAGDSGNLNLYSDDCETLEITLGANEIRNISIEINFDGEYSEKLAGIFTNGRFAEGYIICETKNGGYSLPYMGYIGDWSDALILDSSLYSGEVTLFNGTMLITQVLNKYLPAGINAFIDNLVFDSSLIAFSPNGDGAGDEIYLRTEFLRNASKGEMLITDSNGEIVYTLAVTNKYFTKSESADSTYELVFGWNGGDGYNRLYVLPDGAYTMTLILTLDYMSNLTQSYSFPILLDTEKPAVNSVSYDKNSRILTVSASDNHGIQYVSVFDGTTLESFGMTETELVLSDGGVYIAEFNFSDFVGDKFYIETVDYAYNSFVDAFKLGGLSNTARQTAGD